MKKVNANTLLILRHRVSVLTDLFLKDRFAFLINKRGSKVNINEECKELGNCGLIGLVVTKCIPKKTRRKITDVGDAALKGFMDTADSAVRGSVKTALGSSSQQKNVHIHIHKK